MILLYLLAFYDLIKYRLHDVGILIVQILILFSFLHINFEFINDLDLDVFIAFFCRYGNYCNYSLVVVF